VPSRHRARERALQILFQWDMRQIPVEECIQLFNESLYSESENPVPLRDDAFVESLVRGTVARQADIDGMIRKHLQHWRLERMATVDRNILRLATYELLSTPTPPAVIIDEALELARRFSNDEAVQFVNGVLDAANKEIAAGNRTAAKPS
jgi:transcription antitermination protein NusB